MLIFALMSFVLIQKLFDLQIIQGEDYIQQFQTRTTKTRVIKSTRGNIYDRNGTVLASNVLSYSLTLEDNGSYYSTREKNLTLNGTAYQVLQILAQNGDSLNNNFHIYVDENGEYAFDVSPGFTLDRFRADIFGYRLIDDMTEEQKNASAQDIVDFLSGPTGFSVVLTGDNAYTEEELASHHLPQQLSRQEILNISIIRYQLNTNSFKKYMPVTIATNVSARSVATIMEYQAELAGIEVVEDSVRKYIDDESVAPIIGYIGKASAEELEELREQNPDYPNDAIVGKAGIEQYMELSLQGTDGQETVIVDNLGKVLQIDKDTQVEPIAGDDLYLTIDADWQAAIYEILKQRVAGILLSKLTPDKTFDYETVKNAAHIMVPVYDAYIALVSNSIIDITKFDDEEASPLEHNLQAKFEQKQNEVFSAIKQRLTGDHPPAFKDEDEQMQEYFEYITEDFLQNSRGVIVKDAVDTSDSIYLAYYDDGRISLKEYLTYAASQNWIDISKITTAEGEYLDSNEVYTALTDYIIDYLRTDVYFSKLLYKYMLYEDTITGREIELCLYEQGILSKEDPTYELLASGGIGGYDFMFQKIWQLEIEPAWLALTPCSASAVIVDVNTGKVIACVSYPGYDNNRLTNTMDTAYYSKLALDQSSPFFNKATQQTTAPGSTMKLLSTIAGMMEGVIDDTTYIHCTGSFDYVEPPIKCWNIYGHGSIEIRTAIQESCNYFFNTVGYRLGKTGEAPFSEAQSLSMLQKYAAMLGMDKKSGIELTEASPRVSDAYAVPSYIGQGTHLYTTTQLARYATLLANSGTVYNLSLLDKVTSPEGETLKTYSPEILNNLNLPENIWFDIHDGMRRVVMTHEQFYSLTLPISGKTGTAEQDYYHPNHGLFIGYAPSDEPQYAMAIRIANGYTSGNACLVASDIVKYIFKLKPVEEIITGYASADTSNISND